MPLLWLNTCAVLPKSASFFNRHFYRFQETMTTESLVRAICDVKQQYTQVGGYRPFGVALLHAGWDTRAGFQLLQSDPSGNFSAWKAAVIGKNHEVSWICSGRRCVAQDWFSRRNDAKRGEEINGIYTAEDNWENTISLWEWYKYFNPVEIGYLHMVDGKARFYMMTPEEVAASLSL